ncbi:hypothetical protein N0V82_000893 [Gnomoniopsis sp. IMI 355080]|nr:hypothetical protein N0V82_000893 [Gnomoniopsis sp. IMI 355080]
MRAMGVGISALGLSALVALAGVAESLPTSSTCPAFNNGTFVVDAFQLYPENAKFDPVRCRVYFGALFNASVAVFDPYNNTITESINFPGLSGDINIHLGPALPDASGRLTVLLDAAAAFATGGADVSGTNVILKYDFDTNSVLWQHNISAEVTQGRFGGFQDVAHDKDQNIYIVGTFPGTILRVRDDGTGLAPWFLPEPAALANTTVAGFAGIASIAEKDLLLSNSQADGEIYRFDGVSSAVNGTPILIPRTDAGGNGSPSAPIGASDAILLPEKYCGTVLLVSVDAEGTVVLRSKDGTWQSAETLGLISNNVTEASGGLTPAPLQIGSEKIFTVEEFFSDPVVPGTTAGNRSAFPLVDITAQVDALLAKFP